MQALVDKSPLANPRRVTLGLEQNRLAMLLAVLSSLRDKPLADKTVAFGEVGLSGEIRSVPNGEERLKEAATHGFKRAIVPKANAPKKGMFKDMEVIGVERLSDALHAAF